LKANWQKGNRGPVVIAGSVLADEEGAVLGAFAAIEREYPRALLVLAPRKPEQFDNAAGIISESGRKLLRRRDLELGGVCNGAISEPVHVFLLDSLGELAGLYRLADAVFVGGSLVAGGGHNILEPAAFGKVPIYGPSMENFREMSGKFSGGGRRDPGEEFRGSGCRLGGLAPGTGACDANGNSRTGVGGAEIAARLSAFWSTSSE